MAINFAPIEVKPFMIRSRPFQSEDRFCGRPTTTSGFCTSCEKKLPTRGEQAAPSMAMAASSGVSEASPSLPLVGETPPPPLEGGEQVVMETSSGEVEAVSEAGSVVVSEAVPSGGEVVMEASLNGIEAVSGVGTGAAVCQFIYRGGYKRGQHCGGAPIVTGYCEFCEITQRYRPEAEGLARCKFQWDETAYKRTITCNTFLPDEEHAYCVRCRARANPRVSIPYPTTIEELENQDVDDGDWVEIVINRMNRIRLTDPASCDEMWGFEIVVPNDSDYDDESSWDINLYLDRVQIRKWSSADVTQYLGYALDRDQMSFESNPGNAIDPPELYYYFQQDGFMHGRFTLYPERGIVTEDTGTTPGPIIFSAADWIAHFGHP